MTPRHDYQGFTAMLTDTQTYIVRDAHGEPCGSIDYVGNVWTGYTGLMGMVVLPSDGPLQALRKIAIYHGA